VRERLE
jgi:hypothetical protein